MKTSKINDRVCSECGLIHANGISWHGRCYKCGGELIQFDFDKHEFIATTPSGIQIYNLKTLK